MENFPEFGSVEAVDDEVGGGVKNHEISYKDVHNPSARRNVISTIFEKYVNKMSILCLDSLETN